MVYIRGLFVLLVLLTTVRTVRACLEQVNAPATEIPASLFSSNYPRNYNNEERCSWRIFSTLLRARVYVEIVEADLDNDNDICGDSLAVYNGVNQEEKPIEKICGKVSAVLLKSQREQIFLNFTSDSTRTAKGFYVIYWAAFEDNEFPSCNEALTLGDFPQLLDFSSRTFRSTSCAVLLDAGEGHVIMLKTGSRSLHDLDCDDNFIRVFDGTSTDGPSVDLFCIGDSFGWYRSSSRYILLQTSLLSALTTGHTIIIERERIPDRCSLDNVPLVEVPFHPVYIWIPFTPSDSQTPCAVSAALKSEGSSSDLEVTLVGSEVMDVLNCSVNYIQVASYADDLSDKSFQPHCDSEGRQVYRLNGPSFVLGQGVAQNGSDEDTGSQFLVRLQTKGYSCSNGTNIFDVEDEVMNTFTVDIPDLKTTDRCKFLFNATEPNHRVKIEFKRNVIASLHMCNEVYYNVYDGETNSTRYLGNYTCNSLLRPVFTNNSSSLLVEIQVRENVGVVSFSIEYSAFLDTSEDDLLFEPRSTYYPRVSVAIGVIVGLANAVGGIFLLAMVICYFKNKSYVTGEEEEIFEEDYEEMKEERYTEKEG